MRVVGVQACERQRGWIEGPACDAGAKVVAKAFPPTSRRQYWRLFPTNTADPEAWKDVAGVPIFIRVRWLGGAGCWAHGSRPLLQRTPARARSAVGACPLPCPSFPSLQNDGRSVPYGKSAKEAAAAAELASCPANLFVDPRCAEGKDADLEMSLPQAQKWVLEAVPGKAGQFYIKNTVRGQAGRCFYGVSPRTAKYGRAAGRQHTPRSAACLALALRSAGPGPAPKNIWVSTRLTAPRRRPACSAASTPAPSPCGRCAGGCCHARGAAAAAAAAAAAPLSPHPQRTPRAPPLPMCRSR